MGTPADVFTLTAAISPTHTITPITLTWAADGFSTVTRTGALTDSAAFQWTSAGVHAVTVTVQNPGDTISATHSVLVVNALFPVYLPIILK